jgi:hypothetical protein
VFSNLNTWFNVKFVSFGKIRPIIPIKGNINVIENYFEVFR